MMLPVRVLVLAVAVREAAAKEKPLECEDEWCFGCQELNYCNGHGRCSAGGGQGSPFVTCKCFKGWEDAMCSQRTCLAGRATVGLPTSKNEAHPMRECSNNGLCDRLLGKCMCFRGFAGATCQRRLCPNECSGHVRSNGALLPPLLRPRTRVRRASACR